MKQIATLLVAFATIMSASAAQIAWGTTGALFNGTEQMKTANGYTTSAYLLYLGDKTATWSSAGFSIDDFVADQSSAVATKDANVGGVVPSGSNNLVFSVGDTIPNTTAKFADGNSTFGIVFLSTGTGWGDDKTHYIMSDTFTYSTSSSSYSAATEKFTAAPTYGSGNTAWQAVPEPSTAALALAGLALLLKRRKA